MKIKLAILSLLCSTILLNGCADQPIQPDTQSGLLLKTKSVDEPKQLTQAEKDKLIAAFKDYPKNLSRPLPYYPVKAASQRMEGELKVKFDVDENGHVQNIRMLDTPLVDVFGLSLIHAMEQWRYETGKPAKDLNLVMVFKL